MDDMQEMICRLLREENRSPEPFGELALSPMWAAVRGTGEQCGMAFRFGREHSVYGPPPPAEEVLETLRGLTGLPLDGFAEGLRGREDLYSRAFRAAAMNALSAPLLYPEALSRRGWELLPPRALPFLRPEDRVVCVGFGYLTDAVLEVCPGVDVTDMRPRAMLESVFLSREGALSRGPEGVRLHGAGDNGELLARADVVLMTGSTLVNGTWRELLKASSRARVRGIFGPSAALPPELLREMGYQYMTSSAVIRPEALFKGLRCPGGDPFPEGTVRRFGLLL